jgi:hypothetical protein
MLQYHVETPRSTFRKRRPPKKFLGYMVLMSNILDSEPSSFQEETYQVWWDATMEDYTSIMNNDVWEIVPRLERNSVMSSSWIYKMHYFLGLEVWQRPGEIFLGKGKYVVQIMKRVWMEDCKPMATPMIINLKKMTTSYLELVDPTLYKQLIGSLMYLVNTRLDIFFAMNTLN